MGTSSLEHLTATEYVQGGSPLPNDPGFLIARLAERPRAIMLDFPSHRDMAATVERISIWVEHLHKEVLPTHGMMEQLRGRFGMPCLATNGPICGIADGHDLRLSDVAAFFTACAAAGELLGAGETGLRNTLARHGLLRQQGSEWRATEHAVVIAMARTSPLQQRLDTFRHEACHIDYLLDPHFARQVAAVWRKLPDAARRFLRATLTANGLYSAENQALLETEAHAYFVTEHPLKQLGPAETFLQAAQLCAERPSAGACPDFLSYRGDVVQLAVDLFRAYRRFSVCRIPLLATGRIEGQRVASDPLPAHCSSPTSLDDSVPPAGLTDDEFRTVDARLMIFQWSRTLCEVTTTALRNSRSAAIPLVLWEHGTALWNAAEVVSGSMFSAPISTHLCDAIFPPPVEFHIVSAFQSVRALLGH